VSAIDDAEEQLRTRPVADVGHLLKPGGLREVEQEIARLAASGLRAHVAVAPRGEDLKPWYKLWYRLHYVSERDLLLLFNGHDLYSQGWDLEVDVGMKALKASDEAVQPYYGRRLVVALASMARATGRVKGEPPESASGPASKRTSGLPIALVGGVLLSGGVGWVIARRRRRGKERRASLAEARSSAEQVFADVLLATEEMSGPEATQLREKATRLRDQIDVVAPPNLKQLPAKEESLTLARLRQTENELEALRSSVLQAKRRP
jgi:hypothetical protein